MFHAITRWMRHLVTAQHGGIQSYMATGVLILAVLATAAIILAASGRIGDDFMAKVEKYLSIK